MSQSPQYQLKLETQTVAFTVSLLPIIATIVFVTLFLWLGFWQLDRAEQKRQLQGDQQRRIHAQPLLLSGLKKIDESLRFMPLKVTGRFDNEHQFLVDNKFHHHRVGYQVLTPLIPYGSTKRILVNRGWIPMGTDRQHLPAIKPVTGTISVLGNISFPSKKQITLNDKTNSQGRWPKVIEKVELTALQQDLQKPIYPLILQMKSDQKHGFERNWQVTTMPPARHLGYAFQWFALALAVGLTFLIVNLKRKKLSES